MFLIGNTEDLTQDYQALVERHAEEIQHLLEEFDESQEDIFRELCQIESGQQNVEELKEAKAIAIHDNE